MLVGHLPFLARLPSLLITGNAEDNVLTLEAGALAELTQTEGDWKVTCLMQPRLLPGT
jgi:phosphohistidine phosphatase SixA